jgi:hypothetical protein
MVARDAERLRRLAFPMVIDNQEEAVEFLDAEGYLLLTMRHRINGTVEEYDIL